MSTARAGMTRGWNRHAVLWGGVVASLLGLQAAMCAVAVFLATSDPSTAIESDYHERALRWDEAMAAVRASDALGWTGVIEVDSAPDHLGRREIRLSLTGADGSPVRGADVRVTCFHLARASNVLESALAPRSGRPETYVGAAPMRKSGVWEFRVRARRGDDEYLKVERLEVP